jgi:hypothetical protein
MRRRTSLSHLACLLLLSTASAGQDAPAAAPPPPARSPLAVEEVAIDPAAPGPATLCKLRVKVSNGGAQIASRLAFTVALDGQALPVYANQLYLLHVPPGQVAEVPLYNFWTTESGRPAAPDGKLTVMVTLAEASWVEVEDEDGVEVSRPLGAVPGLPVSKSLTVTLKK